LGRRMQNPKELRERAARLLDLVLIAHQGGDSGLASILAEEVSALTGGGRRSRRRPEHTAPPPETAQPNAHETQKTGSGAR
jgi:hypothetical protein